MRNYYVTAIAFLITAHSVLSQDSVRTKKVKILPVPAFGYSPETRAFVGAVALFTFNLYGDSSTRTSNAKIEFNYTLNKQIITECGWNYFFREENWFTNGHVHYSKYPDLYYGIGATTPDTNRVVYDSNRFVFEMYVLKKVRTKIFTGLNVKYINYTDLKTDTTIRNYAELVGGSTLGLGWSVVRDTRNSLLTPCKGAYVYFNSTYSFSKENYLELTIDVRYYKTWKDKFTVATRLINDFNFGIPPFYDCAFLGGDKFVRGYYYGRYRDNNLSSLQTEFRLPIIWRFGLAAFGGISNIYSDMNSLKLANTKYNCGLGIRFMVDKKDKTNLRLDYAIGNSNSSGFYVSFGESF